MYTETHAILNRYDAALAAIATERQRVTSGRDRGEYYAAEAASRLADLGERDRQARRDALLELRQERQEALRARERALATDPLLRLTDEQLGRSGAALAFIERDVAAGLLDAATIGGRMQTALEQGDLGLLHALVSVARHRTTPEDYRWREPVERYGGHLGDQQGITTAEGRIAAADRAIAKLDAGDWTVADVRDRYLRQAGVA